MSSDGGTTARPRCDGVYACAVPGSDGSPGWNYLRFHPDGRVTVAWAASRPDVIAPYLTAERDELDQGYLTFDDPVFGFSTVSRHGRGEWAGFVRQDGSLFVRSVSRLDGLTTDEVYLFHPIPDAG